MNKEWIIVLPSIVGSMELVWNSYYYSTASIGMVIPLMDLVCQEHICLFGIPIIYMMLWFIEGALITWLMIVLIIFALKYAVRHKRLNHEHRKISQ